MGRYAARPLALAALLGAATIAQPSAAPTYSEWSPPVNLGPIINSGFNDSGPALSKDGLSLYFTSNRPGGEGNLDIWVSQRASLDAEWGTPVNLGPIVNTVAIDRNPAFSRDGHSMFIASERAGGFGGSDIWVAWRAHTRNDFGWMAPVNLGPAVNTAAQEAGPTFFENDEAGVPLLFLASVRGPFADIFVSELMADGSFGPPAPVAELNSPVGDAKPAIRRDGLEIIFHSFRPGSLGGCAAMACFDLWASIRQTTLDPWSEPVNLGPVVNSLSADTDATLSSDRETLIFASNRPGGSGGFDLYSTTRTRLSQ